MTGIALETRILTKSFGALQVTRDVSISLPDGARYALIGPNGAGKTSLINLLTGRLRPDAGQVLLNGRDVTALPMETRMKLGLARTFQINALFPELTPLEAVLMATLEKRGASFRKWRFLDHCDAEIEEALGILAQLRLSDVATRKTVTLAYGQQRLLEIALALATGPKVLLLDEPAAGVPKEESAELFSILKALPSNVSLLFIEHDMDLVFRFSTQIIVLVAGSVLVQGPPEAIAADPRVREVYLGHLDHD